jgi:DNA-binding MarR family transcriptional regulator
LPQILDSDDMLFHLLVVGGTGSGKSNAILFMLNHLFNRSEMTQPALFLFDPAGDASIDLLRAIPSREWGRVVILDPQYVTFGFNLLSLPEGLTPEEKPEVIHAQVDEFSVLLSDAFNTDAANAPRLMWIFKGALYYLYTFTSDPTFWELYNIMLLFTKKSGREIEELLSQRAVDRDIIKGTIEAISKLPQDAYMPVLNRISNFVLPPSSINFRTFCNRKSTIDLQKRMEPRMLTILRVPPDLPNEFRRIFASAIVMRLYFASLKRARALEREGKPPGARTPVVFATDEFRDLAQLKILRTILSQSRKFGLYLWMVVQVVSDVPDELMDSVLANVGPVLAFRGNERDAKTLAAILYPQEANEVAKLILRLADWEAVVRKRPAGGRPLGPPFRVTFPKLQEPASEFSAALGYLKGEMERRYGGALGDRNLVYVEEIERAKERRGECPFAPLCWLPLAYLHRIGNEISFPQMARIFEDRSGWTAQTLQIGLNFLVDSGRVRQEVRAGQLYRGLDPQTREVMWKEPETNDEKMQAREAFYSITPAAEGEFFRFDEQRWSRSGRVGGPLHIRIMKALLEAYWERGYWCAFDKGDRQEPFPDILVTQPVVNRVKGKEGKLASRVSTEEWNEASRTAVEVETSPAKNSDQVKRNYLKNVELYGMVRFVVASYSQMPEVIRILGDKDRTTFEVVVEPVGLTEEEMKESREWKKNDEEIPKEVPSSPRGLQSNELRLMDAIFSSGYTTRAAFCLKLGVSERQVTRYLVSLASMGLLVREANSYRLTEAGRKAILSIHQESARGVTSG